MRESLAAWACFTILDLAVQEILQIILSAAAARSAVFAVWSLQHAMLLRAAVASAGAAAACVPFLGRIRWETGFPDRPFTGIASDRTVRLVLAGVSGAVAAQIAVALIFGGAGGSAFFLKPEQTAWELPEGGISSVWDLGTMCLLYGVLTPVIEELFFRGMLFGKLRREAGLTVLQADLLTAALFAVYHGSLRAGLYAFPVGLLLGKAAADTRSVWPPILLHGLVNLTMLQLSYHGLLAHILAPAWLCLFLVLTVLALLLPERGGSGADHFGKKT